MSERAAAPAAERPPQTYLLTPTASVVENPLNPRKHFDPVRLAELAASIQQAGIVEPLVVRPATPRAGRAVGYELIAGARRLRAAQDAGLDHVPVVVRDLTDTQVLELMVIENNQREDVHPLEEADGYAALQKMDPAYTPEAIAAKVGRSTSYIYRRLKLRSLTKKARQAFERDEITPAHAERLARLTPAQQDDALTEVCFYPLFGAPEDNDSGCVVNRAVMDRDEGPGRRDVQPVSKLDEWIARKVRLQPDSEDTLHFFPELADALDAAEENMEHCRLLELSESSTPGAELRDKKHGTLGHRRWVEIGSKTYTGRVVKRCDHVERGVVVHGGPIRVLEVCATKGCKVHFPEQQKATGASQRSSQAANRQRWEHENAERDRQYKIRDAFWEALDALVTVKAATLKKLDGRVLGIARDFVLVATKKPVTVASLPALLVLTAWRDLGRLETKQIEKFARALGLNLKPLRAAAEAKFPKPKAEQPQAATKGRKKR